MPPILVKAHQALDKAVDGCCRPQPFINETKRIEYLFELYDRYTAGLFANDKKKTTRAKMKNDAGLPSPLEKASPDFSGDRG